MAADRTSRQAWVIWTAAVIVYLAAVFHRGSLSVAGPLAGERFAVGSAALAVFTVLQLGVYAAMQVPTGVLVDKFGAKRVLIAATVLLGLGQVLFALASSYPVALGARVVVGVGDALTWVSLLRLVASHFAARSYAMVVSVSSALGALGGVIATVPLSMALGSAGWTLTFMVVGAATLAYTAAVSLGVRNTPAGQQPTHVASQNVLRQVPSAWKVAGTRLAFWVHFSTGMLPGVLGLLWGYSYLVDGVGVEPGTASVLVATLVLTGVLGGPMVGAVIGRRPASRMGIVITYLASSVGLLAVLSAWPGGRPPVLLAAVAFVVFASGGPVSSVAFALVRDYNPMAQVGTATGVANVGGHSATAIGSLIIGLLLDVVGHLPGNEAYRVALLGAVALLLLGGFRTVVWWRRARAQVFEAEERGEQVPVRLRQRRWDLRPAPARDAEPVPAPA
ncbi:MFS transporter [Actinoalloteichus spitiensis]|uniref:MFS transporter n=1 Tax=Actinoalloteichus spitiensis TaxID=252394 RepID=UPI000375B3DF|nr:MFS transporter [Actinoalloteichus spitiensis]